MNKTSVYSIEVLNGVVKVVLDKSKLDASGNIIESESHIAVIDGVMPAADYLSIVSAHLVSLGYPPISDADISLILSKCPVC